MSILTQARAYQGYLYVLRRIQNTRCRTSRFSQRGFADGLPSAAWAALSKRPFSPAFYARANALGAKLEAKHPESRQL